MEKNFIIDQNIALEGNNFYYDLHNCYNIEDFQINYLSKNVKLKFVKIDGCHANIYCDIIYLTFEDVNYLEVRNALDSSAVDEIGYKRPDDCDLDWLLSESQSKPDDHIIIRLYCDDGYIRIGCKSVHVDS
jgi:hypothetical protein